MNAFKKLQCAAWAWPALMLVIPLNGAPEHAIPPAIVTRYCSGCHGLDGNSELPYIPRLAGLNEAYLTRRVAGFRAAPAPPVDEAFDRVARFRSTSRETRVTEAARAHMIGVANAISGKEMHSALQWYAAQRPAAAGNGKGKAIVEGGVIYRRGIESRGVQACQSCHGSEGQGGDTAPRLAGQRAAYVISQLARFRAGDRKDSPEMINIARSIEGRQVRAIAAYLQSR
jgi:cytochrome c553